MMNPIQTMVRFLLLLAIFFGHCALAQERFSIFVGSDPANVERMLKLAGLRDDDVAIDLGSGDGRIVIGAAQSAAQSAGSQPVAAGR